MGEKACKIDDAIGFDEHVEQVKYPVSFADCFLDQAKARLRGSACASNLASAHRPRSSFLLG
jgi:hypothetical protein